jgi:uncharacterized protein (DUF4415 family)
MRAVSDNPEWTKGDFAKAKPFDEVFPTMRKGRGPNRAPTKELVSLRLSPEVLKHFKADGPGWQTSNRRKLSQDRQAQVPISPPRNDDGLRQGS